METTTYFQKSRRMSCLIWMKSGWRQRSKRQSKRPILPLSHAPNGIEYQLEPNRAKSSIIRWFLEADIVFGGGHPHVVEPAEVVNKDEKSKQAHHLLDGEFPVQSASGNYGRCGDCPMDRAGVFDGCDHRKGWSPRQRSRQLLLIQPGWVGLRKEPILWRLWVVQVPDLYLGRNFIQGVKCRDKLDEETKESGHGTGEMKEYLFMLDWPQSEKITAWKEMWTGSRLGSKLIVVIWAAISYSHHL